jgi:uncharacterized membrane protein YbhN (UPF0104 family)
MREDYPRRVSTAPEPALVEAPSLGHRVGRVAVWLGVLAIAGILCQLLGIDLSGWISNLWDALSDVAVGYLVAGLALQTVQTVLTAVAWVSILRAAYPEAGIKVMPILTCYAVSVAMNGVLPANLGTFTMLFMFVAIIAGATFPGIFAGYLVQKIFFTIAGAAVYLYLFLSVEGSFDIELGGLHDKWGLALIIGFGAAASIVIVARILWGWVKKLWVQAKQGGAILATPRAYLLKVALPSLGGYLAKLGVVAVFLAAYGIPVTFHTVMTVVGGNSIANVTSVTPGGVGVNQAINTATLSDVTDPGTATAYSLGQQLITTAWNILFAVALVALVFGWQGGKQLVSGSYADAKVKAGEMKESRRAKKAEEDGLEEGVEPEA